MLKYIFALAILALFVYASEDLPPSVSDEDRTSPEIVVDPAVDVIHGVEVTSWKVNATTWHTPNLYEVCTGNCEECCWKECQEPLLCDLTTHIQCGKKPLSPEVWPYCPKDDICVVIGCECPTKGCDGSECPAWCETKCPYGCWCKGGEDSNCCKLPDTCCTRPIGDDNKPCPCWCPEECKDDENTCPCDAWDIIANGLGCPCKPKCEKKTTLEAGQYCDPQQCTLRCNATTEKKCGCEQRPDGCFELAFCVEPDIPVSCSDLPCEKCCPVDCKYDEVCCHGYEIYKGENTGCFTCDVCVIACEDKYGYKCPSNSACHPCPEFECPEDHHICPARSYECGCKEPLTCTKCTKGKNHQCCPPSKTCPPLCKPHECVCCHSDLDEEGCPRPCECVEIVRDYYGDECKCHCVGICHQPDQCGPCPGKKDDKGCEEISFCRQNEKKQWGKKAENCDDDYCPCWCPPHCHNNEIVCETYPDPCNGCPVEPTCKPIACDKDGLKCPENSASHGCPIGCKGVLDGSEVICPPGNDPNRPGCKKPLCCLPRIRCEKIGYCPVHSVCKTECANNEKQCSRGVDENGCANKDVCIPHPTDAETGALCPNFQCPEICDERIQKYCQGEVKIVEDIEYCGLRCPERDYCVERENLGGEKGRCPGICQASCADNEKSVGGGFDARGCPQKSECQTLTCSVQSDCPWYLCCIDGTCTGVTSICDKPCIEALFPIDGKVCCVNNKDPVYGTAYCCQDFSTGECTCVA